MPIKSQVCTKENTRPISVLLKQTQILWGHLWTSFLISAEPPPPPAFQFSGTFPRGAWAGKAVNFCKIKPDNDCILLKPSLKSLRQDLAKRWTSYFAGVSAYGEEESSSNLKCEQSCQANHLCDTHTCFRRWLVTLSCRPHSSQCKRIGEAETIPTTLGGYSKLIPIIVVEIWEWSHSICSCPAPFSCHTAEWAV